MRELYLAGTQLAKDLAFCKLVDEIERNPMTRVIKKSEPCIVHEMTYAGRFYDRVDTGFTHIGYDLHYITFVYRDLMFNVEPSTYYPFTDENNPGEFNFVPYVCRKFRKAQLDYRIAYEGIASLDAYLDSGRANRRTVQEPQLAVYGANQMSADWIVDRFGGIREKNIWQSCFCTPTETWNDEHKVVECLSLQADPDGHRDSFMIDLVTRCICG